MSKPGREIADFHHFRAVARIVGKELPFNCVDQAMLQRGPGPAGEIGQALPHRCDQILFDRVAQLLVDFSYARRQLEDKKAVPIAIGTASYFRPGGLTDRLFGCA